MLLKNTKAGNLNKFLIGIIIYIFFDQISYSHSSNTFIGAYTDVKILDKISSKNELIDLKNGEEIFYKDFFSIF